MRRNKVYSESSAARESTTTITCIWQKFKGNQVPLFLHQKMLSYRCDKSNADESVEEATTPASCYSRQLRDP